MIITRRNFINLSAMGILSATLDPTWGRSMVSVPKLNNFYAFDLETITIDGSFTYIDDYSKLFIKELDKVLTSYINRYSLYGINMDSDLVLDKLGFSPYTRSLQGRKRVG